VTSNTGINTTGTETYGCIAVFGIPRYRYWRPYITLLIQSCRTVPDRLNVRRCSVSAQSQGCS